MTKNNTSNQRQLLVVCAPSGGGKTTLCKRLLADFPNLSLSTSTTSRAPRGQEVHGREYFFVTRAEFEKDVRDGFFAEWAEVHGNLYGTSLKTIDEAFAQGKSLLLDIDVQGAESLRKAYPDKIYCIFISPPDLATLETRLRARGTEKEEAIQKRLKNAQAEMAQAPRFDATIINDDLERAYLELKSLTEKVLGGTSQ